MAKTLKSQRTNKILYISIGCVVALLIIFTIISASLNKKRNSQGINFEPAEGNNLNNNLLEQASSSLGKSVYELSDLEDKNEEEIQIQLSNEGESDNVIDEIQLGEHLNNNVGIDELEESVMANGENSDSEKKDKQENNIEESKKDEKLEEPEKNPSFIMPVEGEIVKHYGKEKLIYSETLKEWTTHLGIDIKADKTTIVKASSDGCVRSIKNDPRYGLTVVIEHTNGFSSVYSNLLTAEFVVVGENVKVGQTIGTVGTTATFEILDDAHLHFEILKDGNTIDPEMYIK